MFTHCVDQILRSRRSTRAYKPDPVSAQAVLDILDCAATAPSNSNTQPWRVHVLAGAPMRELGMRWSRASARTFCRPPPISRIRSGEFACTSGGLRGPLLRVPGHRPAGCRGPVAQTEQNFHFFGAPVGLIFSIDSRLTAHSWLDLGLFVQGVMIAAGARGAGHLPAGLVRALSSRDRVAPAHGAAARDGLRDGHGLRASTAPVNQVRMPRASALEFAQLVGFP